MFLFVTSSFINRAINNWRADGIETASDQRRRQVEEWLNTIRRISQLEHHHAAHMSDVNTHISHLRRHMNT